jgi:hypothetical protein
MPLFISAAVRASAEDTKIVSPAVHRDIDDSAERLSPSIPSQFLFASLELSESKELRSS